MRQVSRVRRSIRTASITAFLLVFGVSLVLSQFGPHTWQLYINIGGGALWLAIALVSLIRRDRSYFVFNHLLLAAWFLIATLRIAWPGSALTTEPLAKALSLAGIAVLVALTINMARHLPGMESVRDSRRASWAPYFTE